MLSRVPRATNSQAKTARRSFDIASRSAPLGKFPAPYSEKSLYVSANKESFMRVSLLAVVHDVLTFDHVSLTP